MKISELKAALKAKGMSMVGTKTALEERLALAKQCDNPSIRTADGANPCSLSLPALRQAAAKEAGISPMLEPDEILAAFIKYLASKSPGTGGAGASGSAGDAKGASAGAVDANKVIAKVLALSELDEHAAILNLARGGGPEITASSPVSAMRKAYLKLSLVCHPDRNPGNSDATKAFQGLVAAFERLSQPELYTDEGDTGGKGGKGPKVQRIARSNVGCVRTRVRCPRCRVPWSESKLEGNPDYFYNFMMSGLKQYTCSTCLMEFGCMTALHTCPHCKRDFEYSAADYHRKIVCGNAGCQKEFGFYEFPASDRVVAELRRTIKEDLEKRARTVEQKRRREQSSARRGVGAGVDLEEAFSLGLTDSCPRCGEPLSSFHDEAEQRQHLRECTDTMKHKVHAKAKAEAAKKASAAAAASSAQLDAQSEATWQLLGSNTEQLWMLTEGSLAKQCADAGVDTAGMSKEEMIASVAAIRGSSGPLRLEGRGGGGGKSQTGAKGSKRSMTADSLPTNYHMMSLQELKGVMAAHGMVTKATTKSDILSEIERELDEGTGVQMRITGPESSSKRAGDDTESSDDDDAPLVIYKKSKQGK